MKYYQDNLVKVYYYEDVNVGLSIWRGNGVGSDYRKTMTAVLDIIREKKIKKWIGDVSDFGVVSRENKDWTNSTWFPGAMGAGLRRMAIVLPTDIFGSMSAKEVLSKVTEDVHIKNFDDLEHAKEWIKNEVIEDPI
ncbi:MAG: hypothetical protein AAGJ93_10495 [Bacteroidota bacterium]